MYKQRVIYLLPFLLAGCAGGGGSFEPEVVAQPKVTTSTVTTKNQSIINYKEPEVPSDEDSQEVGYVINVPIPKFLQKNEQDEGFYQLDPANQVAATDESDDITVRFATVQNVNDSKQYVPVEKTLSTAVEDGQWNYLSKTENSGSLGSNVSYVADKDFKELMKFYQQDNTKIGLVYFKDNSFQNASITGQGEAFQAAAIFYQGKNKTDVQQIPVQGTFTYNGQWFFVHQVKAKTQDSENTDGGVGQLSGTYPVNFTVDFASKTLTGQLKTAKTQPNNDTPVFNYEVTADIKGNNFFGTAVGSYTSRTLAGSPVHGSSHSEALVFGSFYGAGATELAGRALAKDNSWAGVFAAKQGAEESSDLIAAGVLKFNNDSVLNPFEKIPFRGNINILEVDGVEVSMKDACCDSHHAVRYGLFEYKSSAPQSSQGGYFVQGIPTPNYQMPTTGSAEYRGHWYGYASVENVGAVSARKLDAKFLADFSKKSLTGKLYAQNQTIDADTPPITVTANIVGNRFLGTAAIQNWRIDSSRDGFENDKVVNGSATVKGMFYGPGANELGGHFASEKNDIGGVFGARQVESN